MRIILLIGIMISCSISNGQIALDSLLVGCYSLDGHANDSSGNGNHGIVAGATPTMGRANTPNSAYLFDGIDDYIEVPNFQNMIVGDEISISIFGKSDGGGKCLFMLSPDANDRCVGCAMYQNQHYFWDYGDFTNGGRMSHSSPGDTQWHHYVFILSASSSFKAIYQNGILLNSSSATLPLINKNRSLLFGAGMDQSMGNIRWKGSIDDIHIYNRALNIDEIFALYDNDRMCYEMTVGIESDDYESKITLSPNPVKSILRLSRSGNEDALLTIYNLEGQQVFQTQLNQLESDIDLTELKNGVYMAHFTGDEYFETRKVVIQR